MKSRVFVDNLFLNVSTTCNMTCSRCFGHLEGFRDEPMMNMDTAQTATDIYFKQRNPDCPNPYVMLFGGEPLLNQDLLFKFIPWIKQKYQSYKFKLCLFTNGLALSEVLLDYFLKNNMLLFVSLDGEYKTHRKNRNITTGEYEHIVSMIKKSLRIKPDSVIPYCVIQREDLDLARDIVSCIASLGAGSVAVTKNLEEHWENEEKVELFNILKDIRKERKIKIYLYPERISDCASCSSKSMMVYPNGQIFDLCYVCSSVLTEKGTITPDDANVMHFGNTKGTRELFLDEEKKRKIIKANMQCTFSNEGHSSIVSTLSTSLVHPLFRRTV